MTRLAVGAFRVDLDALEATVAALGHTETELASVADDLAAQLRRLHGDWVGDAALSHAAAQHRWSAALDELQEALTAVRAAARHAHTTYRSATGANQAMWSQLA